MKLSRIQKKRIFNTIQSAFMKTCENADIDFTKRQDDMNEEQAKLFPALTDFASDCEVKIIQSLETGKVIQ